MTTLLCIHEVEDITKWAQAWNPGEGSRHEMFAKIGVKARTFQDPGNPNFTGVIFDIPDMDQFEEFLRSEEVKAAQVEDGVKVETLKILSEFSP